MSIFVRNYLILLCLSACIICTIDFLGGKNSGAAPPHGVGIPIRPMTGMEESLELPAILAGGIVSCLCGHKLIAARGASGMGILLACLVAFVGIASFIRHAFLRYAITITWIGFGFYAVALAYI
jgi:hypothetical protein